MDDQDSDLEGLEQFMEQRKFLPRASVADGRVGNGRSRGARVALDGIRRRQARQATFYGGSNRRRPPVTLARVSMQDETTKENDDG